MSSAHVLAPVLMDVCTSTMRTREKATSDPSRWGQVTLSPSPLSSPQHKVLVPKPGGRESLVWAGYSRTHQEYTGLGSSLHSVCKMARQQKTLSFTDLGLRIPKAIYIDQT